MNLLSRVSAIDAGFPRACSGAFLAGHRTSMVPALTYIKRLYPANTLEANTWVPRPPSPSPASLGTSPLCLTDPVPLEFAGRHGHTRAWTQGMNGKFGELAFNLWRTN